MAATRTARRGLKRNRGPASKMQGGRIRPPRECCAACTSLVRRAATRSIILTHARQPHQRTVDRAILPQPPASREPALPHLWNPHHSGFPSRVRSRILLPSLVVCSPRAFRLGMDPPICRSRLRRQAPRILQRLAIPVRRRPLVVGQNQRACLNFSVEGPCVLALKAVALSAPSLRPPNTLFYPDFTIGVQIQSTECSARPHDFSCCWRLSEHSFRSRSPRQLRRRTLAAFAPLITVTAALNRSVT